MTKYTLEMRDECGSNESIEIEADTVEQAAAQVSAECADWVSDGSWGDDGASVRVWWELMDEDGDEVDRGSEDVDVEPDHSSLIRAAGGSADCDHDWTAEGEGGLKENPGVWSVGGTAMVFHTHCRHCGLKRIERSTGSQRNPGEHDTVRYEQPDSWCEECQSEECECEASE